MAVWSEFGMKEGQLEKPLLHNLILMRLHLFDVPYPACQSGPQQNVGSGRKLTIGAQESTSKIIGLGRTEVER